jgi:glycosyltransferase involved in cell wall biosynthesis
MLQHDDLRILFLIDSLGMGGAERLMVPYLHAFVSAGFQPRVCAFQVRDGNPLAQDIEQVGVSVDVLPVRNLRNLDTLPRLLRYMREQYVDVLHTQLEFANTFGTIAARILGIPSVCTLHTMDMFPKRSRAYWRTQIMQQTLRHFCSRIIAVSEETRQYHIRLAHFSPEKIVTLYNGINLAPFEAVGMQERQAVRQEFQIPQDAPVLATVAVLRQPKGIQYMLEALPRILEAVPDARYLVVGDGEHRAVLQGMAQTYGIAEQVIFAGTRKDVPAMLAASDIFVLPTLTEALPTVLAEAMGTQKPIIASAVGGVPEMVIPERNGLLVPPADPAPLAEACIRLLRDPAQAQMMGKTGRMIARERFEITVQAQRLGTLYQEVLAHKIQRRKLNVA